MKKLSLISLIAFYLSGCATGGSSPKSVAIAPVATYKEKTGAIAVSDFSTGNCPADGKWEGPDWRKAVASANACVKAKDWRKVELIGNHLAVSAHLTPWGAYYLSLSAQNRKDYPRAAWMMELALKKAPNEGLFHYQMGRLHWEQGEEQLALKALEQASELNADLTDAHYIMGQISLQKEKLGEAEKLFRKALAANSKHWPSLIGMATVKMKSKDWADAVVYLEDGIRQNPRSTKARLALAQIHESHTKNIQEALSAYKQLRSQSMAKRLDETVSLNLDEKISALEKSISQATKGKELVRKPTAEGQVQQ
jgi:tetratricopeptide (TPR) repeat protein